MKRCPSCEREWPDDFRLCPTDGAPLQPAGPAIDLTDTVLGDRYHIQSRIGKGGMGTVWAAEHLRTGQIVAVKVMAPALTMDPTSVARFHREARNAARIRHPNVCIVHDFGETDDHLTYLVLEYLNGESLADVLDREGTLAPARTALIIDQCCEALHAAHVLGIVHRDVKPDNIMLTKARDGSDVVKIVDFGLAKETLLENEPAVTEPGLIVGTPDYMSPEQITADKLDNRSDMYSLALMLFRMLAGSLPFEGKTPARILIDRMTERPASLVDVQPNLDVPPGVQAALDRALQVKRDDRFASILDFGTAVREAIAPLPVYSAGSSDPAREQTLSGPVDRDQVVTVARAAAGRQAWAEAFAAFTRADADGGLGAEDLESLGDAAWWTGDIDAAIAARERAVTSYIEQDQPIKAAAMAIQNGESFHLKKTKAVANAWVKRADRLLENDRDCATYGFLQRLKGWLAFDAGDTDAAIAYAKEVGEFGARLGDPNLTALSLQDEGRALVQRGEIKQGMAMIDEAMASAVAGELTPHITGKAYCNMLAACDKVADYERATEWSDAATRWCEQNADSAFPGICRVFRAKIMRLRGAWRAASDAATQVSIDLEGIVGSTAEAWYEIGEIRTRLGDVAGADEAFSQAHALGRAPLPGIADLRLVEGKIDHAATLIDTALAEAGTDPMRRVRLLPTKAEVCLGAGNIDEASEVVEEFAQIASDFDSPLLNAVVLELRGSIDLARGDSSSAVSTLRDAVRAWADLGFPFETARARLKLVEALRADGDEASADLEIGAALVTLEQLGAVLWVDRAKALVPTHESR